MSNKKEIRFTKNEEIFIFRLLLDLGIPPHLLGYGYIKEAILLISHDNSYLYKITKELYPAIAKKYDTTAFRVERAIRHAVGLSFNRANTETLCKRYSYALDSNKGRLTNSEFLAVVSEYFRLHYSESEAK